MVRFATTCDVFACGNRSAEYTAWPSCRACYMDVCPDHAVAGSLREEDRDRDGVAEMRKTVYCRDCEMTFGAEEGAA